MDEYKKQQRESEQRIIKNEFRKLAEECNISIKDIVFHFDEANEFYIANTEGIIERAHFFLMEQYEEIKKMKTRGSGSKKLEELADKYGMSIISVENASGATPLALILLELENEETLSPGSLRWLKDNSSNKILATYYRQLYERNGNVWDLASASKYLRKAGMYNKAVEITNEFPKIPNGDPQSSAAVFTSRGAAFRDSSNLPKAEECALDAIKLAPSSFNPYSLLGAIYYERGDPAKGDEYFEKASLLGASPRNKEVEIHVTLKKSGVEVRNTIIDYLLRKDAEKYAWVNEFRI
mgnify:FL=1